MCGCKQALRACLAVVTGTCLLIHFCLGPQQISAAPLHVLFIPPFCFWTHFSYFNGRRRPRWERDWQTTESQGRILSNWHLNCIPLFTLRGGNEYHHSDSNHFFGTSQHNWRNTVLHRGYFPSLQWNSMQMQRVNRWSQYDFSHITVMKKNREKLKLRRRVRILDSFFCWHDCEREGYCRAPWIFSIATDRRGSAKGKR